MAPATDWKEVIAPGEAEQLQRNAEALRTLQRQLAKKGPTRRTLHAMGQAGLEAELAVLPDLPPHARVGLFATPAHYRTYVRFSNGHGAPQPDRKPAVRGIGIKVLGAPGRKLIPGLETATTQDFLMINAATTLFKDSDEFVGFVVASARPTTLVPWLLRRWGFRRSLRFMRALIRALSVPIPSLATTHYYSALPTKFGSHAVHYALTPHARPEPGARPGAGREYLREELEARLAKGPVVYDFRVQFFKDEASTPIEDASVEWKEPDAPFLTIARLTLPQQAPASPRGRRVAELVERMSFDPWHASEDFRPLGNMMRARSPAYRLSTEERGAAPEPDGTETLG